MLKREDLQGRLKAMSLFKDFTGQEVEAFLDLAEGVAKAAGDKIVEQDEPGESMFLLVTGKARVVHHSEGKQFELAELGPGDFFGELALVDEGPRSADVVAVTDCELLAMSQAVISALAGVYPGAAFKLLVSVGKVLVSRLRSGNRRYIDSLVFLSGGKD